MVARLSVSAFRSLAFLLSLFSLALVGCKTSTIESRRLEKISAYNELSPEEKQLVDEGQIKIGMSADAVYIAWGRPSEVLQEENLQQGKTSTWRYYGSWMQETRYWAYRETKRQSNDLYLERYLVSDYNPRDYVRAEIVFKDGKVISWRTLPRPTS
jgi:outer membrane protein assembly factor BamE (lipoprotein component of BamABCDE complex)